MPESTTLNLHCPKCDHDQAKLYITSDTIATVQCTVCQFQWSLEVAAIPEDVRRKLPTPGMHRT